jgi:hypothetical protein
VKAVLGSAAVLELHVAALKQLFNAMDPAPFRERDLDPRAEEYIVEWAREVRSHVPLALVVHLDREAATPVAAVVLQEAVRVFFAQRALSERRRLRRLLRQGRLSLLISVAFLAGMVALGDVLAEVFSTERYGQILREGLVIGGWVAMWRPFEIFLYGWWPIRAEARLYDRLSAMAVRVVDAIAAAPLLPG